MNLFTKFLRLTEPKRSRICGVKFPLVTKLIEVRKEDRQEWLRQTRDGDSLQFVHAPNEDNALLVYAYNICLHCLLGRLDEKISEKLIYVFGKGFCVDGEVLQVTGNKTLGCNVAVYNTRTLGGEMEE